MICRLFIIFMAFTILKDGDPSYLIGHTHVEGKPEYSYDKVEMSYMPTHIVIGHTMHEVVQLPNEAVQ